MAIKENLVKRGMAIENGDSCDICRLCVESAQHLVLCCNKSWRSGVQLWKEKGSSGVFWDSLMIYSRNDPHCVLNMILCFGILFVVLWFGQSGWLETT